MPTAETASILTATIQSPEAVGLIVGTTLGAILAIFGTWLGNRHARELQAQQLKSDSNERQLERRMAARREVYLPAADAIIAMVGVMGKMLFEKPAVEDISSGTRTFGAAMTRVLMIANEETIKHVAEYQRASVVALTTMQRIHNRLIVHGMNVASTKESREKYAGDQARLIEMMTQYNLSGVQDPLRFQRIADQNKFLEKLLADIDLRWVRHMRELEAARLDAAKEFIAQMTALTKLQPSALAAIRGELEANSAQAVLEIEMQKTTEISVQAIQASLPDLEKVVAELDAELRELEAAAGTNVELKEA